MVQPHPVTAVQLAGELAERREHHPVGNALLDTAAKGDPSGDIFRGLVAVEAQCHPAELSAYGNMLARFPHRPAADLFIQLAGLVYEAQPKLRECAQALGLTDLYGDDRPKQHAAYAFNGTMSWLASQGSQAAFALSTYTDLQVYFPGCAELARRVREAKAPAPESCLAYYDDEASDELVQLALDVVQDGLDRGDDPDDALFHARLLEESIGEFWRAAADRT
ncbi:hypothetical protein ACH4GK_03785 [Streptomyces rimosus]|uniref:hypothetical protein n=1 Tax=Streptomyces rimosus TaxID=1927 RepID=UPI0004C4AE04|nr:hypothetical protein [Streptomyces rimosus]